MSSAAPTDAAQRRAAIDPTRSFIVQAPAGSGKTELLIQRYLRLLGLVDAPEEIIAITFTRKAAVEMRARVLKALRKAEEGDPPASGHERTTRELALAVLARDTARGWAVRDHPARLRIQTIDSLCARLVGQMPLLSRFGAHLEPIDDATALYREAARRLLADLEAQSAWTPALETLLCHLDNNVGVVENLLIDMLARREHWLRHMTASLAEDAHRALLERALHNVIGGALRDLAAQVPKSLHKRLPELASYAASRLERTSASPILACKGLECLPGVNVNDLKIWLGIASLLLTDKDEWRSRCDKHIGFPAAGANKAETKFCKARKQEFSALLEACRSSERLRACLAALRALPAARYTETQWCILQALFQLLPVAAAQLELIFRARAKVDFAGVASRALDALGPPEEPSDLALMLDYRIQHLLIDEFQDTSVGQRSLLEALTAGWQDGDGRTLFAVGDPMQSIYGFREAEVGVFLRARSEGIGSIKLTSLTLSTNFRSRPGVVQWINEIFPRVFPASEDITAGAVTYAPCEAMRDTLKNSGVQVHCFIGKDTSIGRDKSIEAARVIELVTQAREEDPNGKIAILVRSKTHLVEIVPRLNDAKLKFRAVELETLGTRPAVQDLLALTRALCHPADRLSWLAVLRAPWCGLTLCDLHALAGEDLQSPMWDLMTDDDHCRRLSTDGQRRLSRVREVLAHTLKLRRRRTLRRWIEGAWLGLGGPATLGLGGPATATAAADLENARMYFDLLDRLDEGGDVTDFSALQAGVEALHAAPDTHADTCLQVMTIHKAKGLEFDTVIVPGLGVAPRTEARQLLTWLERVNQDGETDLLIAPIAASADDEPDPTYAAVRGMIATRKRFEDARLLYVAATRARRQLHLLGHAGLKDGTCKVAACSLLERLWPAVKAQFVTTAQRGPVPTDVPKESGIVPML
ncbi:MAG: UvrD-helicase domain-containing protein, partial [Pseudomonadota bacterium]|nr:UvrD-helicase domain-containing protein [Pseudomonadota bacterium]